MVYGSVIDTSNSFGVVRSGDRIDVLYWDQIAQNGFTLQGALLLAAWLARLADPDLVEFHRVAKEIGK
jgi:hypothetical protein